MRKLLRIALFIIPVLCLVSAFTYYLPPVHDRLAWRVDEVVLRAKYAINPPEKVIFVPQEKEVTDTSIVPTITPTRHQIPPTQPVSGDTQELPVVTPSQFPTPTITPTPLPERVALTGVQYQDQHGRWNYCAPANLAMALSFWNWDGDQDVVGPVIKPDAKDKNVMPYEMADYVEDQTKLRAIVRVGGDIELAKNFIAAGYPVLVEKGTYLTDLTNVVSWMGHYQVLTGYDEKQEYFIAQDSFTRPDFEVPYDVLLDGWRAFNYTYIIIFPPEDEAIILEMLGPEADETVNYQNAAAKASDEIFTQTGIAQYFAWFNRGTNLVHLQDYAGAAAAYNESFNVYPTIPESERPWRMLWYQTGPYFAYFYTGDYYETLYLAEFTLDQMQSDKNLEESYYWRAMAKAALDDTDGAIADYRESLKYHPEFEPALYQLSLLGIENP